MQMRLAQAKALIDAATDLNNQLIYAPGWNVTNNGFNIKPHLTDDPGSEGHLPDHMAGMLELTAPAYGDGLLLYWVALYPLGTDRLNLTVHTAPLRRARTRPDVKLLDTEFTVYGGTEWEDGLNTGPRVAGKVLEVVMDDIAQWDIEAPG